MAKSSPASSASSASSAASAASAAPASSRVPAAAAQPDSGFSAAALPPSYEAALHELETLVSSLESGQLPLDQLLSGYQRGAQLLKFCRDKLGAVETQIKVLEGTELKAWTQD